MPSIPAAGVTPASAYTLVAFTPRPKPAAILAEPIGARSREVQSITKSAAIADALVSYLVGLQRGSGAAVRGFGQRYRTLRNVEDGTASLVDSLTREALQPAVDSGTARIVEIAVEVNASDPTQIDGRVRFRDLLADRRRADRTLTLDE